MRGTLETPASDMPTPAEIVGASAPVVRLCQSYHTTYVAMVAKSRRQRIGILALVAFIGTLVVAMVRSGRVSSDAASAVLYGVLVASVIGIAILGALWVRDNRHLNQQQAERLKRALWLPSTLSADQTVAVLESADLGHLFFECHEAWVASLKHGGGHPPGHRAAAI